MKGITQLIVIMVLPVFLFGCQLMGPEQGTRLKVYTEVPQITEEQQEQVFSQLQNQQEDQESMAPEIELFKGTGQLMAKTKYPAKQTGGQGEGKYTLNFDQADLGEVTKVILSDTLGLNYVLNPKVSGTVTLQTSRPLTKDELLPTLEILLGMNNAALLKDGNIYHIEPVNEALKSSALNIGKNQNRLPSGYHVQVIPLEYVGVQDMVEILKPLATEKSILRADEARNMLFVAGTAKELRHVQEIIDTFDVDIMQGMSFGMFPLVNVDPELMIEELENILDSKEKSPLAGMIRFLPIERLNALLVITPQSRYLNKVQNWIARLDRANLTTNGGVTVYRVQNVDAEELADTLNEIFSGRSSNKQQRVSLAPGSVAAEVTNRKSNKNKASTNKKKDQANRPRQSVSVGDLEDIKIIADKINNSLIVVATQQQFQSVMAVIKQLDVMPLQVLIDAMIIEVTLTDELKYGIEWFIQSGSFTNVLSSFDEGVISGAQAGFSTFYTGSNIRAVLNALAEKTKVNVIASPSLMVLNNHEAFINVGDQVSIATESQGSIESGGSGEEPGFGQTLSSFERVDTGVTLIVTPRVNAGGLVVMDIEQEANQVVPTEAVTLTPTISQRRITSTVAIHNGETVVLGGLIREEQSQGQSGVPFLSTLPVIGPLFGANSKSLRKTELVVIITPRVVANTQDAREITNEFKRKLTGLYEEIASEENAEAMMETTH